MVDADLKKIASYAYWIVGMALLLTLCYFVYNTLERPVAGTLLFLGGVLALYFYYVKWFVFSSKTNAWPPYQSLCPDYLTPVSPGTLGATASALLGGDQSSVLCVDFVGVSRNRRIKVADPASLNEQVQNPEYTFKVSPSEKPEDLRERVKAHGLSWMSLFGGGV